MKMLELHWKVEYFCLTVTTAFDILFAIDSKEV